MEPTPLVPSATPALSSDASETPPDPRDPHYAAKMGWQTGRERLPYNTSEARRQPELQKDDPEVSRMREALKMWRLTPPTPEYLETQPENYDHLDPALLRDAREAVNRAYTRWGLPHNSSEPTD